MLKQELHATRCLIVIKHGARAPPPGVDSWTLLQTVIDCRCLGAQGSRGVVLYLHRFTIAEICKILVPAATTRLGCSTDTTVLSTQRDTWYLLAAKHRIRGGFHTFLPFLSSQLKTVAVISQPAEDDAHLEIDSIGITIPRLL